MARYFSKDHEWLEVDADGIATVGITDFAQQQLGDVVYVELPESDLKAEAGDQVAVVESVKAASEVYAPLAGTVVKGNTALEDDSALVNNDPEAGAWFFKIKLDDPASVSTLMTEDQYKEFIS